MEWYAKIGQVIDGAAARESKGFEEEAARMTSGGMDPTAAGDNEAGPMHVGRGRTQHCHDGETFELDQGAVQNQAADLLKKRACVGRHRQCDSSTERLFAL